MEENKEIIEEVKSSENLPKEEPVVSNDLMDSIQAALNKATETINNLRAEVKDTNDKYLRSLADYQNLQRNSAITISKSKESGKISVFKDLLPIIDDFEKAKENGELTEGTEIILNKMLNMFKANGVEVINPEEGDNFDDSVHEAVVALQGNPEDKNTIGYVQFKGYKLGDTILRYAKVGVYV